MQHLNSEVSNSEVSNSEVSNDQDAAIKSLLSKLSAKQLNELLSAKREENKVYQKELKEKKKQANEILKKDSFKELKTDSKIIHGGFMNVLKSSLYGAQANTELCEKYGKERFTVNAENCQVWGKKIGMLPEKQRPKTTKDGLYNTHQLSTAIKNVLRAEVMGQILD